MGVVFVGLGDTCSPVLTAVLWHPSMADYCFGDHHPMHPSRLDATVQLARDLKLFNLPQVRVEPAEIASDNQLVLAHDQHYIRAVQAISHDPSLSIPGSGLGTDDTPGYRGIHEASARLAGASLQAAQLILEGKVQHAVNFSGGMHHASRRRASGFCIYNDCAVAIQHMLDHGVSKVAYIDIDAHHGDGTQSIFWDNPNVLTVSVHESGMSLFPGTGFSNESGPQGAASGTAVNLALPAGTGDSAWLRAFDSVVPAVVRQFGPEVIVSQHGCDSHISDEMSHLKISIEALREVATRIASLADELCRGRWLATGGGGYSLYDAVPRSWVHLIAIAAGSPLSVESPTPESWRSFVLETYGVSAPETMGDGADTRWRAWADGYDPADAVDRTVLATRKEVFPHWGLSPWYD